MRRRDLLLLAPALALTACARDATPRAPDESPQQKIIDRAALAVDRLRSSGQFPTLDRLLAQARGVMVFPRLIKAGIIVGGEGGNGVLLSKDDAGGWSAPAFYSLGAGSLGAQIGYQEATVLLFFMTDAALASAIESGLTLGADTAVAAGTLGDSGEARSKSASKGIVQLVDVGGIFAGVSLDGTVVASRQEFNRAYYGDQATTRRIVIERSFAAPNAARLQAALRPR
ncbi:MAG: lipid-binding SYLF domain-containing protein [Polyangiaceae bacterium]|nr:lipid-binding SYLF domain-containing protein [Polyangiaceae bacterium]